MEWKHSYKTSSEYTKSEFRTESLLQQFSIANKKWIKWSLVKDNKNSEDKNKKNATVGKGGSDPD